MSISAPSVWNSLSFDCRSAQLASSFRRSMLKTELLELFDIAYAEHSDLSKPSCISASRQSYWRCRNAILIFIPKIPYMCDFVVSVMMMSFAAPSDMLHLIFGTSFLRHSDSSSKLFIPLSATFIWTCRFNLLHPAIIFHHFFTVSFWAQNLPVQKILSSTLVCFCLSDLCHVFRPFDGLTCSSVFMF